MPRGQSHAQCELRQTANRKSTQNPQSVLRQWTEKKVTDKESEEAGQDQKRPSPNFSCRPKEQGEHEIELDQHREVPPGCVQIHEVHLDIDKPQAKQAQNDPRIDRFQFLNAWRD